MIDRSKTLTEIEGEDWGPSTFDSHLVITCHKMRHKPVNDLADGDLRMAIGQQFSLPILVPLALERLESDPLLEATFFEGDLLTNVLQVNEVFWAGHPRLWQRTNTIAMIALSKAEHLDDFWQGTYSLQLRQAYDKFAAR